MSKLSWRRFHSDILKLAGKLGSYKPDVIVPCMLGGLIPGAIIAKQLGINDVRPIDIERNGEERRLAYDVQGTIKGKKVLIVEDDLPTGKGPALIKKQFEERGALVKIAAVYVNSQSKNVADFYAWLLEEMPDYPWKKFHKGNRVRERNSLFSISL